MKVVITVAIAVPERRVLREQEFAVTADAPLTFGRHEHNKLPLPDDKKMVSSRHGRLELRGNDLFVVDQNSLNGTLLDGQRVDADGALLSDGATIRLGDYELVVKVRQPEPAATKVPMFDATMASFDVDHHARMTLDLLTERWAEYRRLPATERQQRLAEDLRARAGKLPPATARAVFRAVAALAGGGTAGVAPAAAAPAVADDEALLQAGLVQLRRLATALVGERSLATAADAVLFTELLLSFCELSLRWIGQCRQGRAEFEDQFGAEVTLVFQRSNNPLKGVAPQELGKALLDWAADRDAAAIKKQLEGMFADLTQHQLGLLAGVKEAVAAVVARLAPDAVEELASKDAGWLTSKGTRAWEIYRQVYRDLVEEKGKLFHEVIAPAIRQGYLQSHESNAPRPSP
ncbi:MAG: FHA domain-containing protein [Planctomycetes bacterium]|nr:FHA domain-containing protein [Planctomycetota bacterium]